MKRTIGLSLFFILLLLVSTGYAQSSWGIFGDDEDLVQFSGVVVTADSLKPLPYTNIRIEGSNYGTVANYEGFFYE